MKCATSRSCPLFMVAAMLASVWLVAMADRARAAGDLLTAGKNANGQLGLGNTADTPYFSTGSRMQDVVVAAAGANHTLVIVRGGGLFSCGLNLDGQLGLGDNVDRTTFGVVQTPPIPAAAVAGGLGHSLLATADGGCYATGLNDQGQLGQGDLVERTVFTQITTLPPIVAVAAGDHHSLALDAFGNVWSCGSNSNGQLGLGGTGGNISTFAPVPGISLIVAIAAGANHSMALDMFGNLYVWGANGNGQLGIGGNIDVGFPVWVGGGVIMIAAGGFHSIVETGDGTIWTTGRNGEGQLGLGDTAERYVFTPVPAAVVNSADAIGAGRFHSLLVSASNSLDTMLYVTGLNKNGELGLGDTTNRNLFQMNAIAGTSFGVVCGGEGHSVTVNGLFSTIAFAQGGVTVNEGVGTVNIAVILSPASRKTCTVDYDVTGGTATQGTDYTFTKGTLTFNPGQTRKYFSLTIIDDSLSEDNETILISLSNPNPIGTTVPDVFSVTITDNDPLPTVAFAAAASASPENVANPVIGVQLSAAAGRDITLTCKATGGSAVYGTDYRLDATTIRIPAGATTANVPITIFDNLVPNPSKTVVLTLSAPRNATLGAPIAHTLTVTDDEPPTIQFAAAASAVSESAGTQNITVTLSRAYDKVVTVKYAPIGGTATGGGIDYTLAPGTLTFNPTETSKAFTVTITDDKLPEPDQTVIIGLSGPTNGTLGSPTTHTLTLLDTSPAVLSVQSSGGLDFGNVGVGVQKMLTTAYTISNLGGGTLHAKVSSSDPPFQILDAKGIPTYVAEFSISGGVPKKISVSCVPYAVGPVSRTLTFQNADSPGSVTTRTAKCNGIIQARITKSPTSWIPRGGTVTVEWAIDGGKPTHNDIHWATSLAALAKSPNKTAQDLVAPYSTWFRAPTTPCTVYFQAHTTVAGTSYLSEIKQVIIK